MSTPTPVTAPERISALDTLRGFAVLGILVMNIQSFAAPLAAYMNPTAYGDLTGANLLVWAMSHILFDQKFMTLFSVLFGAGIILFTSRATAKGFSARRLHYRRMLWLLLFGAAHAYLLWYGDILFSYALCGMLVFPLRKLAPARLLLIGLLLLVIGSALWVFFGWSMQFWPEEEIAALQEKDWQPGPEVLAQEINAYRGGWWEQMRHRVPTAFEFQVFLFFIALMWRVCGLMLTGMALYKLGLVAAQHPSGFYARMAAVCLVAGLALSSYGVMHNFAAGWDVRYSFFLGSQFNYWGSLLTSGGWLALVMLACRTAAWEWFARRLAAVGRMAFTNYLMQTVLCTTIFYGHGLGLFGSVERRWQILIVFAVWALQLAWSPLWLRHFHFGPFEWLWRGLTYGTRPPFRRTAAAE